MTSPGLNLNLCSSCKNPMPPGRKPGRCTNCNRAEKDRAYSRPGRICKCGQPIPDGYRRYICPDCHRRQQNPETQREHVRRSVARILEKTGRTCRCGAAIPDGYRVRICPQCKRDEHDRRRTRPGRVCLCGSPIPDDYRNDRCPACVGCAQWPPRFCDCGSRIMKAEAATCSACAQIAPPNFCRCGAQIPKGSKKCSRCGRHERYHLRNARAAGAEHQEVDMAAILAAAAGVCSWCRAQPEEGLKIGHLIPLTRGGAHVAENLVAICRRCVNVKGSKTVEELQAEGNFPPVPLDLRRPPRPEPGPRRCHTCKAELPADLASGYCTSCLKARNDERRSRPGRVCTCGKAIPDLYRGDYCPDCTNSKARGLREYIAAEQFRDAEEIPLDRSDLRFCSCGTYLPDDYPRPRCPRCTSLRASHYHRAKAAGVEIGHVDVGRVLKEALGVCALCGKTPHGWLTIDHIFPIDRGGPHVQENLQALCRECNSKKGSKLPEELEEAA